MTCFTEFSLEGKLHSDIPRNYGNDVKLIICAKYRRKVGDATRVMTRVYRHVLVKDPKFSYVILIRKVLITQHLLKIIIERLILETY